MLLTKWVCAHWNVTMHTTSSWVVTWFIGSNALWASSELMFLVVVSRVLGQEPFTSDFLQFPHLFWTWSMTTMDLRGHRPWDAQLQGHPFLILTGWFARILKSMEIGCSFCMCSHNVSSLMQRTSNTFYFFCIWDSYLAPKLEDRGLYMVLVCACTCAPVCSWTCEQKVHGCHQILRGSLI